ncbi:MAG: ATP synthase F1 subunit delta [bacterium]|nr:ATP synthase F1 subunit delta [bacterium]
MKITAKKFALSLYESVEGKSPSQVKHAIEEFVKLLAEKNQLSASDKIVAEFIKIWNEKHGIVEAEVTSANGFSRDMIKLIKGHVTELSGAKEVLLSEKIDKNILGGVVIRYGDKIIDGSIKTQLEELKDRMVK